MDGDLLDRYVWDHDSVTRNELETYVESRMDARMGTIVVKATTLRALLREHHEFRSLLKEDD